MMITGQSPEAARAVERFREAGKVLGRPPRLPSITNPPATPDQLARALAVEPHLVARVNADIDAEQPEIQRRSELIERWQRDDEDEARAREALTDDELRALRAEEEEARREAEEYRSEKATLLRVEELLQRQLAAIERLATR